MYHYNGGDSTKKDYKKAIVWLTVILIIIIVIIVLGKGYYSYKNATKKNIFFTQSQISVNEGESIALTLESNFNLDKSKVTYKSSDSLIAIVDDKGIVKGIKDGSTTISATYKNLSANVTIKVEKNNTLPMSSYTFEEPHNVTTKKILKVLVVEIDPILSKGQIGGKSCVSKKASQCLGQDSNQVINELIDDIEYSSHGIIDVQIANTLKINEFATYKNAIQLLNGTKANRLDEDTWLDIMKNGWYGFWDDPRIIALESYSYDYNYLINKLDLIKRRNDDEFNEVWLVNVDPALTYESIMVGRSAYWINGEAIKASSPNFKIMNVSISRPDTNFENNGHATENILNNVFESNVHYGKNEISVNANNYSSLNLWEKFTLTENSNSIKGTGLVGVGNVHFSPNSTVDYDWNNNSNKVLSKWAEWQNYPNLTNNKATTYFSPSVYMNQSLNGTKSDARLHHRWWFSLMPHLTGNTNDGYSNNWWDYIFLGNYVTSLSADVKDYTYKVGDIINNIKINYNYQDLTTETKTLTTYENNMNFVNKSLFGVNSKGQIIATSKGKTSLTYYKDGKNISINITIN